METTTEYYVPVLSIAGSDPSGGAGIQQDIKTCEAFDCFGMAAITAITAQSPAKVCASFSVSGFLPAQLVALIDEVSPFAVKVGLIPDSDTVSAIADAITHYQLTNIVVDPVVASSSGHLFASTATIETMKSLLFPLATLITPNIPEAELLTGIKIRSITDVKSAAKEMVDSYGCRAVLIKGGHSETLDDILYVDTGEFYNFPTKRIITPNTHGTGCRLSTAIACGLAKGLTLPEAIGNAKEWLTANLSENSNRRFPQPIND